jgi:hypothetical protein
MPLQPISKLKPDITYRLHFDSLDSRPAVAQAIAECIATWSRVEWSYGSLFLSLLQVNEAKGAELYVSLESAKSKQSAIMALAVGNLHEQKVEMLRRLISYTKSQQKSRDKIAHWIWGISDQLPDSMILCDPKSIWMHSGKSLSQMRAAFKENTMFLWAPFMNPNLVYAYSKEDLRSDCQAFSSLATLVEQFRFFLAQDIGTPEYESLYNELAQDARLAKPEDKCNPPTRLLSS